MCETGRYLYAYIPIIPYNFHSNHPRCFDIIDIGIRISLLVTADKTFKFNLCLYQFSEAVVLMQSNKTHYSKHKQINCSHHPQQNHRVYTYINYGSV